MAKRQDPTRTLVIGRRPFRLRARATGAALLRQLGEYALLIRLDKPIGTLLLLWPTLWALWLAGEGRPDPEVFAIFVAGVFLMRSAGCAINDYADRDVDPHVRRTRDRPLAARRVSPNEALLVFAGLSLIAAGLVLSLNPLARLLAVGGAVLAVSYPFMKRFVSVPQFILGAAFAWSVPMAYAAQTGQLPETAWLLFCTVVLWAAAYDTMYAMVDREDDLRIGVKSTAILFAEADRFIIAMMQLMTLFGLYLVGRSMQLGLWYWVGLGFAALSALWQQYLIRRREPDGCFRAFLNNNLFGVSVFAGILLHYTFTGE